VYTLSQLRKGFSHPSLAARECNRIFFDKFYQERIHQNGIDVLDADWDNLIILDACRFDLFSEVNYLDGTLQRVRSKGTNTVEFLEANLTDADATDCVYVTGNPQLYRHYERINPGFHHVENVWESKGWDEELGTVLPKQMRQQAANTADQFPKKRLIVHYVQPHYPFITLDTKFDKVRLYDPEKNISIWQSVIKGDVNIDMDKLWRGYRKNLELALESVNALLNQLRGKTVITSDHGNAFGERAYPLPIREYGHPRGIYTKELLEIPWFVCDDTDSRKEIDDEGTPYRPSNDELGTVQERLNSLGYK